MSQVVNSNIFRANDIRGVVDQDLTEDVVKHIGQSIGSEAIDNNISTLVIGRDGRLSGKRLSKVLSEGVMASGCNVIDIGAVPTPLLYFSTFELNTHSGIMLTGSHNSPNYNGVKIVLNHKTLFGDKIQNIYQRIVNNQFHEGRGEIKTINLMPKYIHRVCDDIKLETPLKIVVDCGNGIGGKVVPELYRQLGCEVIELFCDVDGHFPNHHPDPSQPQNLGDIIEAVKIHHADVGLAFDGDADRLGVVSDKGTIIWPDRVLMLLAIDVLSRNPNATIIYDVKCSHLLKNIIVQNGGKPLMWKTGHAFVKEKMQESGALLAGEFSGHLYFKERWYGFDDAIYSGARLLEILSKQSFLLEQIFNQLPDSVNTPEIKVPMNDSEKFSFVELLQKKSKFGDAKIIKLDGIRVEFEDGWGLVRASNTTPNLILRFEADNSAALSRIKKLIKDELLRLKPELMLPF